MPSEHSFAEYIRLLARGKTKSRDLTANEAKAAWSAIMTGDVEPEQLGAFLMLMRLKEETAEEVAGFVRGARAHVRQPAGALAPDLDWSSYAGKRRQLPWFLLSVMTLVQNGVKVFMHGADGHTPDQLYTREALNAMGLPIAASMSEAVVRLGSAGFAFLPLANLSPRLESIINLKPVLGLRSPANTVCRLLNPLAAPHVIQGIFHPSFMPIHQKALQILGEGRACVFRGEGGEVERRPNKAVSVKTVRDGIMGEDHWPAQLPGAPQAVDEEMAAGRLLRVWRGEDDDAYARAAVTGTLAVCLRLLERAQSPEAAQKLANAMWESRDRRRLAAAS